MVGRGLSSMLSNNHHFYNHHHKNPQTEKQKALALASARQQEIEGMKELSSMENQVSMMVSLVTNMENQVIIMLAVVIIIMIVV